MKQAREYRFLMQTRLRISALGGGFNGWAQHLLIFPDQEVAHGMDVPDTRTPAFELHDVSALADCNVPGTCRVIARQGFGNAGG
jgi:hypothetical protein